MVDLTGVLAFAFSTAPEHVSFGPPPSRERPGLVLLVGDDAYLGCRFREGDGLWETAYLNVATGEISGAAPCRGQSVTGLCHVNAGGHRAGSVCLNRLSGLIGGASAGLRPPRSAAAG